MNETRDILLRHRRRYPWMTGEDCIKLLYQMEYGAQHMMADRASALAALKNEMAEIAPDPETFLLEDIGNGLCRLHLAKALALGITAETILLMMEQSFQSPMGNYHVFLQRLGVLRDQLDWLSLHENRHGGYQVDPTVVDCYLQQGIRPLHHSAQYQRYYHPHYRVVDGYIACTTPAAHDLICV